LSMFPRLAIVKSAFSVDRAINWWTITFGCVNLANLHNATIFSFEGVIFKFLLSEDEGSVAILVLVVLSVDFYVEESIYKVACQ
jgi:hypothetical protein